MVEDGVVAAARSLLIRPPTSYFQFTDLHGIGWSDVKDAPAFMEVWRGLAPILAGAHSFAAHNAPFDRSVLQACCARSGLRTPRVPFVCTVQVARRLWNIRPTRLPDVCRRLGIGLDHHDAASDAFACAQIVARAYAAGGPRALR